MLIDWVTCSIDLSFLTEDGREAARSLGDRIERFCPKTGQIHYSVPAWDSIRSDSHQISVRATNSAITIMGSPARVLGDGCAVFGSGASSALSLGGCVDAMRLFVQSQTGIQLPPDLNLWRVSRADVTGNLALGSLSQVRDALRILRDCEGGRYRVSNQAGDTVYWSSSSILQSGKAYAKGAHLRYLMKQKTYTGRPYTEADIISAEKILRLELRLGRLFFHRNPWQSLTPYDLKNIWTNYFSRMIGDTSMTNDIEIQDKLIRLAQTPAQGRAAYGCWLMIQSQGWERARDAYTARTWYRHLKYLRMAGLGDADISAGKVVPLRRNIFSCELVTSWQQLHKVA